jgi:hypothetical protein
LNSVQIPKCPALNTVDIIISIFHANTPPRVRQQSSDVPSARTHKSVGARVVSLELCNSPTNTWTRSSFQSVLRKPQRKTKYDRPVATSSSSGNTSRGIIIALYSHRAASSSCGIIHRTAFSSQGIVARHRRAALSITRHHREASSSRGILYCAASS